MHTLHTAECRTLHKLSRGGRISHTLLSAAPYAAPLKKQQVNLHDLSMLLLLNQNLLKRTHWHLVPAVDLAAAEQHVKQLPLAVLLVELLPLEQQVASVLYANPAAHGLCDALQLAAGSTTASSSPTADTSSSSSQGNGSSAPSPSRLQLPASLHHQLVGAQQQHKLLDQLDWPVSDTLSLQLAPALLCPVQAPNDELVGVALLSDAWRWSDGAVGCPGWPRLAPQQLPSAAEVAAAAEAVRQQAEAVRRLKQVEGRTNKDPSVVAAVAALQHLKQQLAALEAMSAAFCQEAPSLLEQVRAAGSQEQSA